MKYLRTYENKEEKEQIYSNVAWYLEEIQPVSQKNGFIECLFDYEAGPHEFSFYFKDWTDEEEYEKFYTFLEEKGLKIYDEKSYKMIIILNMK